MALGQPVPVSGDSPVVSESGDGLPVVYAITNATPGRRAGGITQVVQGHHWWEHDPVVQDNPHLFSRDPRWGMQFTEVPPGYRPDGSDMGPTLAGEVPQVLRAGVPVEVQPTRGHRAAAGVRRGV